MPVIPHCRSGALAAALLTCLSLGACSTVSDSTRNALTAVTPYKVEVVQGNFVSREQVAVLKPGMTRQQVRDLLGTSLLSDVFHANRWDYVFTIRRQGVEPQQRRLTLYFSGELLDRFEGDEMPTEEEFVATLDTRGKSGKVPQLEMPEEKLKQVPPVESGKAPEPAAARPPLPASYPPLESTAR